MELYETYATTFVKDIFSDTLKSLINIFMIEAGTNMGNDFTDKTLDRTIEIIESQFKFLPVCYIRSAFKKGSLGNYGAGRLVPRTIYGWLNEISLEYNRDVAHKEQQTDFSNSADLMKFPSGQAICKKIDWYNAGLIDDADWDKIDLKALAGMIGRGEHPTTKDFGIKK